MKPWIVALLFLPVAGAQLPNDAFDLQFSGPAIIDPVNPTDYRGTLTVGCNLIIEANGEVDAHVEAHHLHGGLTAEIVELHFGFEDCFGSEEVTKEFTITLVPEHAHGLEPFDLELDAEAGEHATNATQPVMVGYVPGHTISPAGDQTFNVTDGVHQFSLQVETQANAPTMIKFENITVSGQAQIMGLEPVFLNVANEETEATLNIEFTGAGEWVQETVEFTAYSQCAGEFECPPHEPRTVTWTFINASPSPQNEAGETKDTPALPAIITLLAITFLAWRKQ